MLVLSRNKNQKVNFPSLGISVEILEIQGSKVRVGVDAPLEVRILRDELVDDFEESPEAPHVIRLPKSLRHELRNTLNELSLMMHVYHKRQEKFGTKSYNPEDNLDAKNIFEAIVERLSDLKEHRVLSRKGMLSNSEEVEVDKNLGTALVVDDDDNERELLAGFLRMCGYHVETACDGLEAIDYLKTHKKPNFILLDMNMPRCDGTGLIKQIAREKQWKKIPVYVISGLSPEEAGLSSGKGYSRWFSKPLDPRTIVEELQRIEHTEPQVA